ncbi:MAG: hypothetical protein GY711_31395 [bacterium]|nr:hypothetical protein [bacterium]
MSLVLAAHAASQCFEFPEPRSLRSPDGRLEMRLTPGRWVQRPNEKERADDERAQAQLMWSDGNGLAFPLAHDVMPHDAYLLDTGDLITFDGWLCAGHGRVLERYDGQGTRRWSKTLEELIGHRVHDLVSWGCSRTWRSYAPDAVRFAGIGSRDPLLAIDLQSGDRLHVDLESGAVRYEDRGAPALAAARRARTALIARLHVRGDRAWYHARPLARFLHESRHRAALRHRTLSRALAALRWGEPLR